MDKYKSFSTQSLLRDAQNAGSMILARKKTGKDKTKGFKMKWESYYDVVMELKERGFSHRDPKWYLPGIEVIYDPRCDFITYQKAVVISGNSAWVIIKLDITQMMLKVEDFNRLKIAHIL